MPSATSAIRRSQARRHQSRSARGVYRPREGHFPRNPQDSARRTRAPRCRVRSRGHFGAAARDAGCRYDRAGSRRATSSRSKSPGNHLRPRPRAPIATPEARILDASLTELRAPIPAAQFVLTAFDTLSNGDFVTVDLTDPAVGSLTSPAVSRGAFRSRSMNSTTDGERTPRSRG
jgi:hypothetical protein